MADIDPGNTDLVKRERRLFTNLSRLPLQVFTLRANQEWSWPEGFADARYADTAYLPYVLQRLQIRGYDAEPITSVYSYTFAEVDGDWLIISDDDVTDQAGQASGTLPWDVADIRVHRTPNTLGIFDAGTDGSAERVMAWAEESVRRVRADVPRGSPGKVVFYALSDDQLLQDMGERYLSFGAVAFPVLDHSMWPDHVASTRVVINPTALPRNRWEGVRLLSHEITHVALARSSDTTPAWLQEGLAEYVSTRGADPALWWPSPSAMAAARDGISELPRSTFFGDKEPELDYDLSLAGCAVIAATYGEDRLWDFLAKVDRASRADGDGDGHVDEVLQSMFGLNQTTLARKAGAFILRRAY